MIWAWVLGGGLLYMVIGNALGRLVVSTLKNNRPYKELSLLQRLARTCIFPVVSSIDKEWENRCNSLHGSGRLRGDSPYLINFFSNDDDTLNESGYIAVHTFLWPMRLVIFSLAVIICSVSAVSFLVSAAVKLLGTGLGKLAGLLGRALPKAKPVAVSAADRLREILANEFAPSTLRLQKVEAEYLDKIEKLNDLIRKWREHLATIAIDTPAHTRYAEIVSRLETRSVEYQTKLAQIREHLAVISKSEQKLKECITATLLYEETERVAPRQGDADMVSLSEEIRLAIANAQEAAMRASTLFYEKELNSMLTLEMPPGLAAAQVEEGLDAERKHVKSLQIN